MKKLRKVIRISIGVLVVLVIVGIALLIINYDLNVYGTSYEIISFLVGSSGIILAIMSQLDAQYSEKRFQKMVSELDELRTQAIDENKVDRKIERELSTVEALEQRIYKEIDECKNERSPRKRMRRLKKLAKTTKKPRSNSRPDSTQIASK